MSRFTVHILKEYKICFQLFNMCTAWWVDHNVLYKWACSEHIMYQQIPSRPELSGLVPNKSFRCNVILLICYLGLVDISEFPFPYAFNIFKGIYFTYYAFQQHKYSYINVFYLFLYKYTIHVHECNILIMSHPSYKIALALQVRLRRRCCTEKCTLSIVNG